MLRRPISFLLVLAALAGICLLPGCAGKPDTPPAVTTVPGTTAVPGTSTAAPAPTTTVPATTVQPTTVPPTTVPPTTVPPTTVPPTTVPPTTVPAPTSPPADPNEMIGTLYNRGQLMAIDGTVRGYGCGRGSNGSRPAYPVADQTNYGKYDAHFIGPDEKVVYLTFDCGYEYTATNSDGSTYRVTEKILDVLKAKNVKAVFFITGHYARSQPDLVQRMIDEGHTVGNHTNNHPNLPKQSIDTMVYEIMSLHEYVKEHFGGYEMNLLRPPEGAYSARSLAVTQSLGYKTVDWSFAYADWDTANQPNVQNSLKGVLDYSHNGALYLLHAVSTTNASILGDAIDGLQAKGFEIKLFQ